MSVGTVIYGPTGKQITIENGVRYNAYFLSDETDSPEKDYETVEIKGRNGDLHIENNRFKNRVKRHTLFFAQGLTDLEALDNALQAYDGYIPIQTANAEGNIDHYMMGRYIGYEDVKRGMRDSVCRAVLRFDCKPQKFLLDIDRGIVDGSTNTVNNTGSFPSKPIIHVSGTGTLTIGGTTITVNSSRSDMVIDSELERCYGDSTLLNYNSLVEIPDGLFPTLPVGTSSYTSDGLSGYFEPRFWRL